MREKLRAGSSHLLLGSIRLYRVTVSPLLGPTCRFDPSCSVYAETAIRRFGPWRGAWLGLRRILRCHPRHAGGHDPVPPSESTPNLTRT